MVTHRCRAQLASIIPLMSIILGVATIQGAENTVLLWPDASGVRPTEEIGRVLPARENENPPAIRITDIAHPYLKRFNPDASTSTGASVVILPGGGYNYAVVGKEGAEIAKWFNDLGITAFVLHYRTPTRKDQPDWLAPVQDAQQAVRLIRTNATAWQLDANQIGIIGFSAGGNAAAIATTNQQVPTRPDVMSLTEVSARPSFSMLIYPWKLLNTDESGLRSEVTIDKQTPPTFLVHAHDDGVTSLSSVEYYKAMRRIERPAELHIYANGGHGYGLRPIEGSTIHTWTDRAADWLIRHGYAQGE